MFCLYHNISQDAVRSSTSWFVLIDKEHQMVILSNVLRKEVEGESYALEIYLSQLCNL